jgi:SAM-dependent methyltransferase
MVEEIQTQEQPQRVQLYIEPSQEGWDKHYVLNLGCGKFAKISNGINVDIDPACEPDLVWDLNQLPLPFEDNKFDRVNLIHIFEHLGDPWLIKKPYVKWFFEFWNEIWRVLKPGGLVQFIAPNINNEQTWGDPGHCRAITPQTLCFLSKKIYQMNVDMTSPMTQYDIQCDFEFLVVPHLSLNNLFIAATLRAIKDGIA